MTQGSTLKFILIPGDGMKRVNSAMWPNFRPTGPIITFSAVTRYRDGLQSPEVGGIIEAS